MEGTVLTEYQARHWYSLGLLAKQSKQAYDLNCLGILEVSWFSFLLLEFFKAKDYVHCSDKHVITSFELGRVQGMILFCGAVRKT